MRLFRRRETLNQRLLREGGLGDPLREDNRAPWDKAGIHGVHRPREWDEVVTAEADVHGDTASFVVLDDEIVIDEGRLWTIGVRRIEVLELPGVAGEELELVARDGFRQLNVDGSRVLGTFPQLERDGDYVIRGRRLGGDLWEVEATPL